MVALADEPVDPARHVSERDPALMGPIFTDDAFVAIQEEEMRRLYRPADPAIVDRAWAPILADLETIRAEVTRPDGQIFSVTTFPIGPAPDGPSVVQIAKNVTEEIASARRVQRAQSFSIPPLCGSLR